MKPWRSNRPKDSRWLYEARQRAVQVAADESRAEQLEALCDLERSWAHAPATCPATTAEAFSEDELRALEAAATRRRRLIEQQRNGGEGKP